MTELVRLEGPAAALLQPNINTDIIAPLVRGHKGSQQPAGIRSKEELSQRLFGSWRYLPDGMENPEFVLNRAPFRSARFLLAGPNFACGSSRETAATMLNAFGIRCVIAPSFGEIFHDNCYRNHMLALAVDWDLVQHLTTQTADGAPLVLDLQAMTLTPPDGQAINFSLPTFRREMLLSGADEVTVTLGHRPQINAYQARVRVERPWELQLLDEKA